MMTPFVSRKHAKGSSSKNEGRARGVKKKEGGVKKKEGGVKKKEGGSGKRRGVKKIMWRVKKMMVPLIFHRGWQRI